MSVIDFTVTDLRDMSQTAITSWPVIGATDTYAAYSDPGRADRSVQMSGTWNGATVVFQGSNDNATWFTLHDPQGNSISMTADGLMQISEITRYVRPARSAGTPTAVTALLFGRKTR